MTEDEMVGWYHQLKGHESEQALGDGEGQESLACCSPWDLQELDRTEQLNNNKSRALESIIFICSLLWYTCHESHFLDI